MIYTIAIDGPAASGKTVVGRLLARRLGCWFLDTGVMYRAITWLALERGVSPGDAEALGALAESNPVQPVSEDGSAVEVAGHRLGPELRESRVDNNVSNVSKHPNVRRALVEQQRNYAAEVTHGLHDSARGIVMVGRDIGAVVLPWAEPKVFLTASAEQRARRRWREMQDHGQNIAFETVRDETEARDVIDSSRDESPLRPAEDAWLLDSSDLSIDGVVDAIVQWARGN